MERARRRTRRSRRGAPESWEATTTSTALAIKEALASAKQQRDWPSHELKIAGIVSLYAKKLKAVRVKLERRQAKLLGKAVLGPEATDEQAEEAGKPLADELKAEQMRQRAASNDLDLLVKQLDKLAEALLNEDVLD